MLNLLRAARRGAKFARRRPQETLLVARMALDVAAFSVLARLLPLPRSLALVAPAPRRTARAPRASDERIAELLDALLKLNIACFTPTCWKRAVVLHRQLALRGRETRVLFGLRREGGDLLAGHAWVESGGQPIFEDAPPEYAVTYSFPS